MENLRIHPNGFLQADLSNGRRLHVWHPDLPRQKNYTPIHDHVFGFKSEILCGHLMHTTFLEEWNVRTAPENYHYIWIPEAEKNEETTLIGGDQGVHLKKLITYDYYPYDKYTFDAHLFHTSEVEGLTATIMTKTYTSWHERARVAIPYGETPDNSFVRTGHEDVIRRVLKDLNKKMGYNVERWL